MSEGTGGGAGPDKPKGPGAVAESAIEKVSDEHRLKMLMDYTKFHIGFYAVIITTLLALSQIGEAKVIPEFYRSPILISLVLVLVAGVCGGIIAGNLPEQTSFDQFWDGKTGIWGIEFIPTKVVARAEHIFFWLAVFNAVAAVYWGKTYWFASAVTG